MIQHDPQHTGQSPYVGTNSFGIKWKSPTAGPAKILASSAAISADGKTVYIGSDDKNIYAFNAADGTQIWNTGTANTCCFTIQGAIRSSPAIDSKGFIYVGSEDGSLYAIDTNGIIRWAFPTGAGITSSPATDEGGIIYFGSMDGHVYAVDSNGNLKWRFPAAGAGAIGSITSSPAISKSGLSTVYIGDDNGELFALDANTGALIWIFQGSGSPIRSSPSIDSKGIIYVGSDDGKVYAVDANGNQKWAFATGGNVRGTTAISSDGKTIYAASKDGNLYAINSADGSQKWSFAFCVGPEDDQTCGRSTSSPAIDKNPQYPNGVIFIASFKSVFGLIDKGQGMVIKLWDSGLAVGRQVNILSSTVIGPDGTVYVGGDDQKMYAIRNMNVSQVPEFGAGAMLATGFGVLALFALRRRLGQATTSRLE
jgi:outer membrane protein assembly factor BamB